MSVPDNSRPKAPPSLLADGPGKAASAPANGNAPNGSRILANLEGRVVPPAAPAGKPPRSSKTAALIALLVIGAGAFGAWHVMTRSPSTASSAAAPASATVAVAAAAATNASQAVVAGAQTGAPDEASASHAATIVADDDAANAKPAANNGASAPANDAERLSRALADGAGDASGATVAAAASRKAQAQQAQSTQSAQPHEKAGAKHQTANARRAESKSAVAQAKKPHSGAKKDDSDVDLLAVLVARTKPADAKAAANASKSRAKSQSTTNAPLAQQVKACGDRGFFEDQLCRWRVCDGHWGTDPACPSAARASNEH